MFVLGNSQKQQKPTGCLVGESFMSTVLFKFESHRQIVRVLLDTVLMIYNVDQHMFHSIPNDEQLQLVTTNESRVLTTGCK